MNYAATLSNLLGRLGLRIVNKKIYRKDYFLRESQRLLHSIQNEYDRLIGEYPTPADHRKGVENQALFVEMVHWLELERMKPLTILDIGGRGGLFAYFCKKYGHNAYVSDLPGVLQTHPNTELLKLFGINSLDLMIKPFTPTDTHNLRFDLVTGFRTRFHSRLPFETGKPSEEHWGIAEWRYFLQDLSENVLSDSGQIFFMLNRLQERHKVDYVPVDLQQYFFSVGGNLRQNYLHFPTTKKIS